MKAYPTNDIRNIAVLGHGAAGKTTLCDAMLYICKETDKIGNPMDKNLILDYDEEEKKRGCSISTAVFSTEYKNKKLNIIDAPGQFDFTAGVTEALNSADSVIIALSGKSGLNVGSEINYQQAKDLNKPISFFIGKLNSPRAHFSMVMSQLTGKYGSAVCPIVVPYSENDEVKCYVNLIENKAYKYNGIIATETELPSSADIENLRTLLIEASASQEETLMEKYFDGEELSKEEIISAVKKGFIAGEIYPVFSGINQDGEAIDILLDGIVDIFPSFDEIEGEKGGNSVVVFKTVADAFVGKLSYFKVLSGEVKADSKLKNMRNGEEVKFSKVMYLCGKEQVTADKIIKGDIGCVAKVGNILTNDILADNFANVTLANFAKPTLSLAVYAVNKGDEEKQAQGLLRLAEEDPTIRFYTDKETKEQILGGLGEQHLDVIKSKLKKKFGVDMELKTPKIAYRETIRKKVKVQGKHKKQSGGHGQFGDVWIEFEPAEEDFIFEEKIFGGSVPKNYFPAVEKGLIESAKKGVLAGFPMVGFKATLVDGSYHPVDSSEMAFKTAAELAYKAGILEASPTILEPIGKLRVFVPDDYMGDIIGDITKRRGRVLGMDAKDNKFKIVEAEVPIAEMTDFSVSLRAITGGWATFELTFEHYEEAPAQIIKELTES